MSADRYEIIDDGTSIIIAESNGIRSTIDPVDGQHLDDAVIGAIRQQSADIAELRAELNRERQTNAVLRRDLADPPPDIQELALKKCGHFEIVAKLRADLAAAVARAEQAEARLAAVDAAPTVALTFCHPYSREEPGQLIARPAKD